MRDAVLASMDARTIAQWIRAELAGLDIVDTPDTSYYFYDPQRDTPHDKRQPFATIVHSNAHDTASALDRPGVYRLNLGVRRETYREMFGPEPAWSTDGSPVATGHDFTRLDTLLPHPVYAPLSWISILSPSAGSWPRVQELLREAHAKARAEHERRRGGEGS